MSTDKDRLDELKQYSIPTSEYWWISGPEIAVSKSFFKYWSMFIFTAAIVSTVIACETNLWQRFLIWIFVTNWAISIPLTLIVGVVGYFWFKQKQKRKAKLKADILHRRRYEEEVIKQGGGGKR